jgi:hypothetical protein
MMERPAWQRILYNVWPTIRRFNNEIVTILEKVFVSSLRTIIRQIKQI